MKDQQKLEKIIENKIFVIQGKKVILDNDLAELYGVETKYLKRQVNRNKERFPEDFMFILDRKEVRNLRCQNGTLGWGQYQKYLPYAFTQEGVAMLSSVLTSKRAIQGNIQIMRIFIKLREMLANHDELKNKIEKMEQKYDHQFKIVFDAIRKLIEPVTPKLQKKIGFH